MWQKTSSNKTCPASMCVCLCYKPRKRHLPLPKNAKFRGSETQLHSFVLWRFGSSPALCVRAAFTSSAGGTGHDKMRHENESIFSCNWESLQKQDGWSASFGDAVSCVSSGLCAIRVLALSHLQCSIHPRFSCWAPTHCSFGKAGTPFWRCEHLQCATCRMQYSSFIIEIGNCWNLHRSTAFHWITRIRLQRGAGGDSSQSTSPSAAMTAHIAHG